jgi:hypothetical protein
MVLKNFPALASHLAADTFNLNREEQNLRSSNGYFTLQYYNATAFFKLYRST